MTIISGISRLRKGLNPTRKFARGSHKMIDPTLKDGTVHAASSKVTKAHFEVRARTECRCRYVPMHKYKARASVRARCPTRPNRAGGDDARQYLAIVKRDRLWQRIYFTRRYCAFVDCGDKTVNAISRREYTCAFAHVCFGNLT